MRRTNNTLLVISFALSAVMTGCVLNAPPPRNSRYSVDISDMEKSALRKDTWVYRHPTKHVTDYVAFNIPKIAIYEKTAEKISPENRALFETLAEKLRAETIAMMRENYPIVDAEGKGALRLEISILDIKPIVHLKNSTGNLVTIMDRSKIGTKFEMNCYDTESDELIFAVSSLYNGPEYAAYKDSALLKNVEPAYTDWAAFFKNRLDDARAKK
jgi:hypothetical protein